MYKTKAELDAALAAQEITQVEYDKYLAEIEAAEKAPKQPTEEELISKLLQSDALKEVLNKQVQSAEDKVRTQYAKEKKALEQEVEALKTAKMSEEERAAHALAERERIVAEKEAELQRVILEGHATKVVGSEKFKLPSEVVPFILAENETEIENRANTLKGIIEREAQKLVEAEFAKHNYVPGGAQQSSKAEKNPFSKEHYNLTEQGRLFRENPEKAKQLAAQAGIKL